MIGRRRTTDRPPLVTEQQHTPPPVNPTRTETPEPRSYGEQLRSEAVRWRNAYEVAVDGIAARDEMLAKIEHDKHTYAGRIVRLEGEKANLEQRLEGYTRRVAELEHTVNQLALAAHERQDLHAEELADMAARFGSLGGEVVRLKAELAAAGRPESTDPEPTGPLPHPGVGLSNNGAVLPHLEGWALPPSRQRLAHHAELMDQEAALRGPWPGDEDEQAPRVSDDLLATGWLPRSSGGQSAPLVGE